MAGDCSLREALAAAGDGDSIVFAPALVGGSFTLTLGQLIVVHDVTIDGGLLGLTVRNGSPRLFRVQAGAAVTISGLTLRNAAANPAGDKHGGAVYNAGTSPWSRSPCAATSPTPPRPPARPTAAASTAAGRAAARRTCWSRTA